MVEKERLYDSFGELIYVLAMADGKVQVEEMDALEEILSKHPWAEEIEWSFQYERKKKNDPTEVYKKALQTFVDHGPDTEYARLLEFLEEVAKASEGFDYAEKEVILNFQYDFKERLKKDLELKELMDREDIERVAKRIIQTPNTVTGVSKEQLYTAFGEIVYLVAKADGEVQKEEIERLRAILEDHELGEGILWSFNYELKKENAREDTYNKAMDVLQRNGPDPEYDLLVDLLEKIAVSSDGMYEEEANLIMDIDADLRNRFLDDLGKYELK